MNTLRTLSLALVSAIALPALASAQVPLANGSTNTYHFDGVNGAGQTLSNGVIVGPYQINITTPPTPLNQFDVFCIDYDDHAQSDWSGRAYTFADLLKPANATAKAAAENELGGTITREKLNTIGYLANKILTSSSSTWAGYQSEIWSIFSTNSAVSGSFAQATADMNNALIGGNDANQGFDVIIDTRAFDGLCSAATVSTNVCTQAFIFADPTFTGRTITPEPSTYALMGFGLLAVGYVRRRKTALA